MLLDEARETDTTVTDEDVSLALQAAEDATAEARRLDGAAVADAAVPAAEVVAARENATLAARRADLIRGHAHRAAQARRLLALDAVGDKIDILVDELDGDEDESPIDAALGRIADAVTNLRAIAATHDKHVLALLQVARELDAERPGAHGGAPTSARVAYLQRSDGVTLWHGQTQVHTISLAVDEAIQRVVAGDLDAATKALRSITRPGPRPVMRYLVNRSGAVFNFSGRLPRHIAEQVARGDLMEMPTGMAQQWRTGYLTTGQVSTWAAAQFAQYRPPVKPPRLPVSVTVANVPFGE